MTNGKTPPVDPAYSTTPFPQTVAEHNQAKMAELLPQVMDFYARTGGDVGAIIRAILTGKSTPTIKITSHHLEE
jgi:hypothetical protein